MPKTKLDSAYCAPATANSVAKQIPAPHTRLAKFCREKEIFMYKLHREDMLNGDCESAQYDDSSD